MQRVPYLVVRVAHQDGHFHGIDGVDVRFTTVEEMFSTVVSSRLRQTSTGLDVYENGR